jgi:hypothetical protein
MEKISYYILILVCSVCISCSNNPDHTHDHTGNAITPENTHDDDHKNHHHGEEADHNDHNHHNEANDHLDHHGSEDHTILSITRQPFVFVVKTGGRIMVDSKDIVVITAKSSGIVKFTDHFLFPGVKLSKGQHLFTISGDQLSGDNSEFTLSQIRADLNRAEANYERAKLMISERIITQENFLSLKNEYEKVLNEFNNLNSSFGKNGNAIQSPDVGYIREIFITEGQKVTPGQPLASVVIEHNLVLKADISPEFLNALPFIEKANFRVSYSNHLYKTEEMNGQENIIREKYRR